MPAEEGSSWLACTSQIASAAEDIFLDASQLRVSVVIPARNEAPNLPAVLARLPPGLFEVILVDGQSVDDTVAVARTLPTIRVVHKPAPVKETHWRAALRLRKAR